MSQSVAGRPELEAARLLLERMGISPADLLEVRPARPPAPTFAEYVPVVAAAVSPGTRRAYGTYWNRVVQAWGDRRIDEPLPSEIEQLRAQVQANVVARRNNRGGRSAAEHMVAAPTKAARWAVQAVAKAGTLGVVGVYPQTVTSFPFGEAMMKNLTVKSGNCHHRRYIPELLRLVSNDTVDPAQLLTRHEPLTDVLGAYRQFQDRDPGWLKVALTV
ncbi:MDR/zinc-dependent alcohol dehydrogenase-like family protein [Plantactinospora alkalitolerans]|uniref:hypothetical protein n=1 Tax=Plantactinospora alkalitolerans TaxID=2789879 RepID=UPI001E3E2D86|nr:hypothetical protein [Plantactinospora alkalitolerans]